MKSRRIAAVAMSLAVTLTAVACGSGSDEEGATVTVPEGDPIVLGMICSCSGAQAAITGLSGDVLQVWADSINDSGGLNGHPIKLIIKDDGGVPEKGLQAAKELVEQDKVVALVGNVTGTDEGFQSYIESKKIPVVGGFPTETPYSTSPYFFASGTGAAATLLAQLNVAKDAGLKKIGVLYCAESPICAQASQLAGLSAQLTGLDFASAKISGTAPDYTAQCLTLKEQGVDALYIAHNASVLSRVGDSCAQVSFEPTHVSALSGYAPTLAGDPNFEGSVWASPNANYLDTSVPAIKRMTEAIDKYEPSILESDQYSELSAFAYFGGLLFEVASEAGGGFTATTTSAEIMEALYLLKDETLDGAAPPLNFVKGQPAFPTCYFSAQLEDGSLKSLKDGKATCLPDAQVKALTEALAGAA